VGSHVFLQIKALLQKYQACPDRANLKDHWGNTTKQAKFLSCIELLLKRQYLRNSRTFRMAKDEMLNDLSEQ